MKVGGVVESIRLGLNNDTDEVYSKAYLEIDYDNDEIKSDYDKVTIVGSAVEIDLAIVIVQNNEIYTNAFQYFNDDIVKLAMLGKGTSKLYKVPLTALSNLCNKLRKFNLVLISGVCQLINEKETFLDILLDRYDVYDNLIFIDDGVSLSLNTLFNNCMLKTNKADTVIYSEVAVRNMLNLYNDDMRIARMNTAMLISVLRARRCLYISSENKAELERKLLDRYNATLNKILDIRDKDSNFLIKKPGAIRDITRFVGYNKCTQLKRLVLATKNNFNDTNYANLCLNLYNSTYKMLSYGLSYGVKMRNYSINTSDIKIPFAFAVYNDINDKLFIDNKHYLISFEFLGLFNGGVEKIYEENSITHSDLELDSIENYDTETNRQLKLKEVRTLRDLVDTIDINSIEQDDYMKKLTEIIVQLEKLGYYVYRFDRHEMSITVSKTVKSIDALNDIHRVIKNSFIEKAISRTHIIDDNRRRYWFMHY